MTVTVTGVNDCPTATDDFFAMQEDTDIGGNLLANDSDPEGDKLTVTRAVSQPVEGHLLKLTEDGVFIYEPKPNYSGNDTFVYEISDGECTATATGK